jgi:multidrug resistance efflux pump
MSAANRWRAVPLVFGICLGAASLVGANRLLHPTDPVSPGGGDGGKPVKNPGPVLGGGIVVPGTVDSDPQPIHVGPPAVAPLTRVKKVLVREGQEVKPGDNLVQFDDDIYKAKLAQASAELAAAKPDVKQAEIAKQNHEVQLKRLESATGTAETNRKLAEDSLRIARNTLEETLKTVKDFVTGQSLSEQEKERRRNEDPEIRRLRAMVNEAQAKANDLQFQLEAQRLEPVDLKLQQAQAKVQRLEATVQEAEAAVNDCLVKAPKDVGGVVEQLRAAEGVTYGPSTREPVLILVPAGKRIVRAEVQAEFAYKVAGWEGKKVTVYDDANFALTYEGTVRRVATSFLPKRGADVALTVSPTKVLEVVIDVADPAPANKAPLRVGQPVRVSFEQ